MSKKTKGKLNISEFFGKNFQELHLVYLYIENHF